MKKNDSIDDDYIDRLITVRKDLYNHGKGYMKPKVGRKTTVKLTASEFPQYLFSVSIYENKRSSSVIKIEVAGGVNMVTAGANMPLVRIDLGPRSTLVHTNPGGLKIYGSHIHVYRAETADGYAYPLDEQDFIPGIRDTEDRAMVFEEFRKFCNITELLQVEWGLGL